MRASRRVSGMALNTVLFVLISISPSMASDTLSLNKTLANNQTLISSNGNFELGFFSPPNSSNRYVGAWYHTDAVKVRTVFWVANRAAPINDSTGHGILSLIPNSSLAIRAGENTTILWSTPASTLTNPTAKLLDDGNFVVVDANESYAWQSFDHPSDTMVAGMTLGVDLNRGVNRTLTAPPPPPPPPPLPLADQGSTNKKSRKANVVAAIATTIVLGIILLMVLAYLFWLKKRKRTAVQGFSASATEQYNDESREGNDLELPLFDLDTIASSTDNFSMANKLGEGGFGPVYKGNLGGQQEIAVKRLAKTSVQGLEEFKNEVNLIAKLQHRNLVRLLGCCIRGPERMLIYEYMPNGSLDAFIFNKTRSALVDWRTRYSIIQGISRGLVYLHHDSRLRIIHRDLKASNILLDLEMNPKISDFGMARIFGGDETEANTRKVVGTYGYMSPEYAMDGVFSVKSDVFSFGVLVLEIISGRKNRGAYNDSLHANLLGHAWSLWNEGNSLHLVDESIGHTFDLNQVIKCTRIGLLCVQQRPEERPLMSSVVLMLGSDTASLPIPKQPGFVAHRVPGPSETDSSSTHNDMTFTMFEAR